MLPTVGITHNEAFPVEDDIVRDVLDGLAMVRMIEVPTARATFDEEELIAARAQGIVALIVRPGWMSRGLMSRCPDLRFIALHSSGFDNVDLQAAADLQITVTNAPGGNALAVAELTIGMCIAMVRQLIPTAAATGHGLWDKARAHGNELSGRTLGILGVGQVGSRVAQRALAFDMRVIAYDPAYTAEQLAERAIEWLPLDRVVEASDLLTLHVPLDSTTMQLLNADRVRRMKAGAFLLNLARGRVIDEVAVETALRSGRLAGAALDVRDEEPPADSDGLRTLPNVIVTPHIGGSTTESVARLAAICADEVRRFLRGEPPTNAVALPRPRGTNARTEP